MKEENKIRSITWIAISLIVIALWFTIVFATCGCTSIKHTEHFSTREFNEARITVAEVVFTDSIYRLDVNQHYNCICRMFWQVDKDIKWVTYSVAPCPVDIGYRMPLLTKR